jgi:predicted MPP superfamily phosphohydrolase
MPRWIGAVIFFSVVATIWTLVHVYLYTRVASALDLGSSGRTAFKVAVVSLALAYLVGRLLDTRWDDGALVLTWIGAVWMGFAALAATAFAIRDLAVALPVAGMARWGGLDGELAASISRWSARAALGVAGVALAWGLVVVQRGPTATEIEVPLKGLAKELDGFRIVQVSDIHIGETVGEAYLAKIVGVANDLDADLVVVTGDVTDQHNGGDGTGLRQLAGIHSRNGVLVSTGNHEVYAGGQVVVDAMEAAGMKVLRQSHVVVAGGLVVAGVDDPTFLGGRDKLADAMATAVAGRPEGLPVVLLSHQPLALEAAANLGVGLVLCGHTHGGQIPPFQVLNRIAYSFIRGLHRVGDMQVYVSNGSGYWGPPVRVFADPEVVRVTLRAL